MPDPIFADPRLAAVYDAIEGPRDDLDAYVALADELGARRIIDLGCGTGSLALRLAVPSRVIIGIDPASASLEVARSKPGADAVTWIVGDAAAVPTDVAADLVLMTGNAAQAVIEDHTWSALLRQVHDSLGAGGCFVFESRRPEGRAWEDWDTSAVSVEVPGIGTVEQHTELVAVDLPLVSFRHSYRFLDDDVTVVSDSTIRFRERDELAADLHRAGFAVREVRDAPDRPGRELVLIADHR